MKKRIKIGLLLAVAMLLTACGGPSAEKIKEVQAVYAELVDSHNKAVEEYANLEDNSLSGELDEMTEKLRSIGAKDAQTMTEEELDAVIVELQGYLARYEEIHASINELAAKVQPLTEDLHAVPVTLRNNTGVELFQLYLYKASDTDKGVNLAEDIGFLDGYQTRNILNLYMKDEERLWILEAIDEEGNTIEYAEIDFTGYGEEGVTLNMEYSFDTMEGWIDME